MRYSDFVLRIGPPVEGAYPVTVEDSPGGKGSGSFRIPFATGELHPETFFASGASWRDFGDTATGPHLAPEEVGGRLFAALFSGEVGKLFERSFATVERVRNRGLRIWIRIDPETTGPTLQAVPWEMLFWTERRSFLSLSRKSPILRSLDLSRPFPSPSKESPLRILVVMADSSGLDLEKERTVLHEALGEVPGIKLSFLATATRSEVSRCLRESPDFHVLHYMGHGGFDAETGEGGLDLAGAGGYTPGSALAQILREAPSLRLAVLNGCHTARSSGTGDPFAGVAPALLLAGLPVVVAMQYRIPDDAAIEFSKAFYEGLIAGEPVEVAVGNGRQAIYSAEPRRPEWALPVLFLGDKSGRLFDPPKPRQSSTGPLRAYLLEVVRRSGRVAPPGIPRQGRFPSILLDSVFVPLHCRRFESPSPGRPAGTASSLSPRIEAMRGTLVPFGSHPHIALLGGAGSGKTTLLHWLALRHASARLRNEPRLHLENLGVDPSSDRPTDGEVDAGPSRVPVLIRLAEYNAARRQTPSLSLYMFLTQQLPDSLGTDLLKGPVLILLDGLDEIAEPGERYDVAREIDLFLEEDCLPTVAGNHSGRDSALQVVVTSRLAGYGAAPLGQGFSHWLLEPLSAPAAHLLVTAWRRALGSGEEAVDMPAQEPPSPNVGALIANPQLATLWAILSRNGSGHVLRCRVQLYEAAVDLWIEDWRRRCELESVSRTDLLDSLAEWVSENEVTKENGNLAEKLRQVLPANKAELASCALNEKSGSGGLLHPAFREYLAACWLASDPEESPRRLLERLGEPRWRESLRMALGRLSADQTSEALERILLRFLATDDPFGKLLPRAAVLLIAAMPEMLRVPERVVEETASRLIGAWADRSSSGGPPALLRFLERTLSRLAAHAATIPLERALRRDLEGDSHDRCLAAAHLSRIAGCASVEIAEVLTIALARDSGEQGWPVDAALRHLARRRPDLLPSRPGTFRRELWRNADLRQRLQENLGWRRIALALYGDPQEPERMHRDSAVTPCLLSLLETSPGKPLASTLRQAAASPDTGIRSDALLALMALGEPVEAELRENDPAARRALAHLSRIAGALETSIPGVLGPALTSLERAAGSWLCSSQGSDLASAVIDVALAFGGAPVQILSLAKAASPEARPRLLAEVWNCLVAGAYGDPAYNLAVLLDTEGEFLASPPLLLAETLALVPLSVNARWDRHRAWLLDRRTSRISDEKTKFLTSALDSIAGLAPTFDFVRSWALIVLAPLLRETDLEVEALILALWSLTDRFEARDEAVRALAVPEWSAQSLLASDPGPTLLSAMREMGDPFLRLRALLRLAEALPTFRDELLARLSPQSRWRAWFARLFQTGADLPDFVREISEPVQRSRALESLAVLDPEQQSRWASLALSSIKRIRDPEDRIESLVRLAPCFPPQRRDRLLLQALRQIAQIPAPGQRVEALQILRPQAAVSPALREAFERAASLQGGWNRALAHGLDAPLLLKAEPDLGESAAPLVLGAILNDLRRKLTLPTDLPSLWAALADGVRRDAARAALHAHGRARSLRLTGEAADSLDRLIAEGDLETVLGLQPLLGASDPSALLIIERWLEHPDSRLRNVSALLLAERHGVSGRTVAALLTLLAGSDDRLRHRSALALHGDFSPERRSLSAAKMGAEAIEELARSWLRQKDQAPGIAKTVAWTFERIGHDDARSLEIWTARLAQGKHGAREAEVILGAIEHLRPAAEPAFLHGLQNSSPRVQRAFLRSTCRLLARGRLGDDLWLQISSWLPQLHPHAGNDLVLADSPSCLIDALREAYENRGETASREIADRALASRTFRLSDALQGSAPRELLTQAGRTARLSGPRIRAAAEQIAAGPELLPPLLAWLCARLGRDVQDEGPFCPVNSDLLALTAASAERLPDAFLAAASSLPELRPRLRDAVCLHDSFPGRREALHLLAFQRRLTVDVLKALRSGLRDVAPVQAAALESLSLYREADQEIVALLVADLADPSPWIALTSSRLLAILAHSGGLPSTQRKEALQALAAIKGADRDLYALGATPPLEIVHLGRLDEIVYESLAAVSGLTDLLGPEVDSRKEERQ